MTSWWLGVLLYVLGAVIMAGALNLQKYSLNNHRDESSGDQTKSVWKQRWWIIGLLLYILSGVMLSSALLFATQSQVSPLMSIVIVANVLFAHFLLAEPIDSRDIVAIIIIVAAVCITTVSAPVSDKSLTVDEIKELFKNLFFIIFIVSVSLIILGLLVGNKVMQKRHQRVRESGRLPRDAGSWTLYGLTFASLAGCFGGLCVTFMKSTITVIVDEAKLGAAALFSSYLVWLLTFILCVLWVLQLYWLNSGLKKFPSIFIVSIEAIVNEFVAVLGGMLYFQEYQYMDSTKTVLFIAGFLFGALGISLFASKEIKYDSSSKTKIDAESSSYMYPNESSVDQSEPLLIDEGK